MAIRPSLLLAPALAALSMLSTTAHAESAEPAYAPAERPIGFSMGFGGGYNLLDANLFTPGQVSARIRLPGGLTLEPILDLSRRRTVEDRIEFFEREVEEQLTYRRSLTVAVQARYPFLSRDKMDLLVTGGAFASSSRADFPEEEPVETRLYGATYGFSVEYWLSRQWCLSFTGTNELFSYRKAEQELTAEQKEEFEVEKFESKSTTLGPLWNPNVVVAIHAFY